MKSSSARPAASASPSATAFRSWAVLFTLAALALGLLGSARAAEAPGQLQDSDYVAIGDAAAPPMQLALRAEADGLVIGVRASGQPRLDLGVAMGGAGVRVNSTTGTLSRRVLPSGDLECVWRVAPAAPGTKAYSDQLLNQLRIGVAASWPGGPNGQPRRIERYLHLGGAPHLGLGATEEWRPFDVETYQRTLADRRQSLAIHLQQPVDGKATVVIEDADGKRVRNLLSGVDMAAGAHTLTWDGLDDEGKFVVPGDYRWRAAHHAGLKPDYLFAFGNGGEQMLAPFGTNHGVFSDVTTNGKLVFVASPLTEGGYAHIALAPDGTWLHGYPKTHGTGIEAVAAAADADYLYIANDGAGWGQRADRKKPDWQLDVSITLTRIGIEDERPVDFPGTDHFAKIETHGYGPGTANPVLHRQLSLTGMVLIGDRLYVGSRAAAGVLVVDKATAKIVRTLPLPEPGALATDGTRLYAISGTQVVELDLASGKAAVRVDEKGLKPTGLSVAGGKIYVADGGVDGSQTVRMFSLDGAVQGAVGVPGGPYEGAYVAERLIRPRGIAALGDRLWVTEQRRNPKRFTAFDLSTGKVIVEKAGNGPYASPGGGFDPADPEHWIGLRAGWKLNFETGEAICTSVLQKEEGHLKGRVNFALHYRFVHQDGRIFLLGQAKAELISELMPDGSVRDLAAIGGLHLFQYACGWDPPAAFDEALKRDFPNLTKEKARDQRGLGVMWVDLNGDGDCQADEFQFATAAERFGIAYWGNDQHDLTLRYPATVGGKHVLVTLKPEGYLPSGAPKYPALNDAIRAAVPLETESINGESTVDRFGNLFLNGDPWMTAYSPDGHRLWRFPNRWTGVHGSHKAPLPEVGVMQGVLFFLGTAPLDATSDVVLAMGNHGRCFALTSDGMYLDEMFTDVRVSRQRDEQLVGGEPFGGYFAQAADGRYLLQTGSNGYRIYQLNGLDTVTRSAGALPVTPETLAAAQRQHALALAPAGAAPRISGSPIAWDRDGQFPASVAYEIEGDDLLLRYEVADGSPWVNHGRDWTTLFKTGDCVDFQFGADSSARADRNDPVLGDRRLLVAPWDGAADGKGNGDSDGIAVLYEPVSTPDRRAPATFASPWRSLEFDRVTRLERASVTVQRTTNRNYTVRLRVPLADLGLAWLGQGAPGPARELRGDFGVIYGDSEGTQNILRSYWANPATALVNDVPGEAMLTPRYWGTLRFPEGGVGARQIAVQGVLVNSGELGDSLVRFAKPPAIGLGAVLDPEGGLWDRAGKGQLNRYAADGRLLGSYPLPPGSNHLDTMSIAGDTLVLQLNSALYRLSIHAAPGTAPEPLQLGSRLLSARSHEGRIASAEDGVVYLLDPATGEREATATTYKGELTGLELLPDGSIYTRLVGESPIGDALQLLDGVWWGQAWHSTVLRYDADRKPAPGVVLGGNSGSFIGHVAENPELIRGKGMAWLGGDSYAVGGESGTMHLLQWRAAENRFEIVRRIGSMPTVDGLGMDRQGRIFCNRGVWQWTDGPASPGTLGINMDAVGQAAVLDGDTLMMAGLHYGTRPKILYGGLDKELIGGNNAPPKALNPTGAVTYKEGKRQVLLLVAADGSTGRVRVSNTGQPYELLEPITLTTASPVRRYTSLAMADADTLLAAADGAVLVFRRAADGENWTETRRWASFGEGAAARFGAEIWITADAGRLWVADTRRHRLLCFALDGEPRLLASAGTLDQPGDGLTALDSPTRIAANGERAVVFDANNQRLVRLALIPSPEYTVSTPTP